MWMRHTEATYSLQTEAYTQFDGWHALSPSLSLSTYLFRSRHNFMYTHDIIKTE